MANAPTTTPQEVTTVMQGLGGYNKLKAMIAIKHITYDKETGSVTFKFKGSKLANCVKFVPNIGDDGDWAIEFWKVPSQMAMMNGKPLPTAPERHYPSQMPFQFKEIFEYETKLLLSL